MEMSEINHLQKLGARIRPELRDFQVCRRYQEDVVPL